MFYGIKLLKYFINIHGIKRNQESWTGRSASLKYKRFQDILNSMGLILNLILGHSAILCLKKGRSGVIGERDSM